MNNKEGYGRCARCGYPVRQCICRPGIDYNTLKKLIDDNPALKAELDYRTKMISSLFSGTGFSITKKKKNPLGG